MIVSDTLKDGVGYKLQSFCETVWRSLFVCVGASVLLSDDIGYWTSLTHDQRLLT